MGKRKRKTGQDASYKILPHRGHRVITNSNPIPTPVDEKNLPEAVPQNLFEFWQKFLGQLGSKSPSYIPMIPILCEVAYNRERAFMVRL